MNILISQPTYSFGTTILTAAIICLNFVFKSIADWLGVKTLSFKK